MHNIRDERESCFYYRCGTLRADMAYLGPKEVPQPGPARAKTWAGVLATAGGLIFYGQPNGGFAAVDQRNGKTLWHFPTNVRMKASPMTFSLGGNQYVAVPAGPNILCFGL